MPSRYIIKKYKEKGFYHIFNRGVEKREIFVESSDYKTFIYYLKIYLTRREEIMYEIRHNSSLSELEKEERIKQIMPLENYFEKIELLCYVLMPNHFHFLIRQNDKSSMVSFMRSLMTKYIKYFNKKYERVGPLFQSRYKAVEIDREEYLLHLSRYIHLNPKEIIEKNADLASYPWSSYPAYVNNWKVSWLSKNLILSYFKNTKGFGFSSYQRFVEDYSDDLSEDNDSFKRILLE